MAMQDAGPGDAMGRQDGQGPLFDLHVRVALVTGGAAASAGPAPWVNNAGILSVEPFLEVGEEAWGGILDVNLKGQFLVAQAAARELIRLGRGGRIVNVSSVGPGDMGVGFAGIAPYAASKGASSG